MKILVLPGDGIGPEITAAAVSVAKSIGKKINLELTFEEKLICESAIKKYDKSLPNDILTSCYEADAIIAGPIKKSKNKKESYSLKFWQELEKQLGIHTYMKPVKIFPSLHKYSYLKEQVIKNIDFILLETKTNTKDITLNQDTEQDKPSKLEIEYSVRVAFDLAKRRRGFLAFFDKYESSEYTNIFLKIIEEVAKQNQQVTFQPHFTNKTMFHILKDLKKWDVLLTSPMCENLASNLPLLITGSKSILPIAKLGNNKIIYQPMHGCAEDITGKGYANPLAAISCIALMLDLTFGLPEAAKLIDVAINKTLIQGYIPIDFANKGESFSFTDEITEAVLRNIAAVPHFIAAHKLTNSQDFVYPEGL